MWIYNADNTLARRGINICPISNNVETKFCFARWFHTICISCTLCVSMHMNHTLRKKCKSEMYYVNCGIILVPKFCIFSRQCEHNTNVGTDALRNWDQYKSQMYYINSGFILVPKFCSFSMQCVHGTNYSTDAFFFCISQQIHPNFILARFGTNIVHMCLKSTLEIDSMYLL